MGEPIGFLSQDWSDFLSKENIFKNSNSIRISDQSRLFTSSFPEKNTFLEPVMKLTHFLNSFFFGDVRKERGHFKVCASLRLQTLLKLKKTIRLTSLLEM